jgi:Na+-transporting NADH:ubiquinone oxidoreductase subunit C
MADNRLLENPLKALKVVIGVALLCAVVVSITAIYMRPYYVANLEAERMARLTSIMVALDKVAADITPEKIEARLVELESGRYEDAFDVSTYDSRQAQADPAKSSEIPPQHDLAGIKRHADYEIVYLLRNVNGQIDVVILPVNGVGYQSALYGYLALAADANEILALKFHDHGETPGLGSRIQDPNWEAQWPGKLAFND